MDPTDRIVEEFEFIMNVMCSLYKWVLLGNRLISYHFLDGIHISLVERVGIISISSNIDMMLYQVVPWYYSDILNMLG